MHIPISRRTALRASGVAIGLPFLESMYPALGREPVAPPGRMVLICNTLGLHPPALFPGTSGRDYESTQYLDLLTEHRDDFTLFSGLSHTDQNGKQPHDTEMTWLSAARNPGLGGFRNSVSVDQYAAKRLGHVTHFPSVALSSNTQKSQSYTSNGVMLPAQDRPSTVFAKLFLEGSPRELRRQRHRSGDGRSILDSVADPQKIAQLKIIETEILRCFNDFLNRMKTSSESDGHLLDRTSVLFGSNLGNANPHDPRNLPIILAGGGYHHGQYVAGDDRNNTPLCNLFVTLLNGMGIETESFASSSGTLQIS